MTIAQQAMLVRLSISQMGLSHKDHKASITANQALQTGKNTAGYFRKFKVQRSDVMEITRAISAARQLHRHYTTPFGDDQWRLLNSTLVFKYTQELRGAKLAFESAVSDFVNNWSAIISRNQTILGPIFDASDYPAQAEVGSFYDFKTEFRPVPQGDHLILQIETETLDKLRKELEVQNEQAVEAAKKDLWKRLYQPVKHMAERLSENKPRFRDTLVGNIETIINILPDLNVDGDPKLSLMADEIKDKLCGFTPGQLRQDPTARQQTAEEANAIIDKMSSYMGDAASA